MGKTIKRIVAWFAWLTGSILNAKELWGIFAGSSIVSVIISAINSFIRELPIPLLVIFCIGSIIALFVGISYIYSFIKRKIKESLAKKKIQPKPAIGLLVGRNNGKIINCHASGKITIHGKPEDVDAGGLIGAAGESSEVVDSSADAKIEYKQD
ncbi:MAG: GLUG motif-containing protein [Dehalococcoidales bacterium]